MHFKAYVGDIVRTQKAKLLNRALNFENLTNGLQLPKSCDNKPYKVELEIWGLNPIEIKFYDLIIC